MDINNLDNFIKNFFKPNSKDKLDKWLKLDNIVEILNNEIQDEYILLFASSQYFFLHSVFIEDMEYSSDDIKSISCWSGNPYSTWSISCFSSEDNKELPIIEEPMSNYNSPILSSGEQIIFGRCLDGIKEYENYYEINQKITHSLGLHYLQEKHSWCKIDKNGDIEECIKHISYEKEDSSRYSIIFAKKSLITLYGNITNQNLCRMFDITSYLLPYYDLLNNKELNEIKEYNIYGTLGHSPNGSYFRGFQILNEKRDYKSIIRELEGIDEDNEKYVDLWINDIKHKKVIKHSSSPSNFDSYFEDTGKPWGMSPAFFNAEVLIKYKNNTEKYIMRGRSIICKGAWSLNSYDINSKNQVSVYLCDFHHLPYKEQLHWEQYNEKPKAFISEAAIETDFLGIITDKITSLEKLKNLLYKMKENRIQWWQIKNTDTLERLSYPYTNTKDEWAEELLKLDQIIVEGLNQTSLQNIANKNNANTKNNYRQLKLLESILVSKNFEEEYAHQIMNVFHEIHNLRNSQKGHASGNTAENERKEIIKKYSSYTHHFEYLIQNIIESFQILIDEIN